MENQKITLNGNEVLSVNRDDNILINHHTYKAEELIDAIGNRIDHHKKDKWCIKGVPCEILTPNQSWQKGKVKISLEFIPDEIESPLDYVRKEM
jgi:hypothetical protein